MTPDLIVVAAMVISLGLILAVLEGKASQKRRNQADVISALHHRNLGLRSKVRKIRQQADADLEEVHAVLLAERAQFNQVADERDKLLAQVLHDQQYLETTFDSQDEADEFLASRRRAMGESEK